MQGHPILRQEGRALSHYRPQGPCGVGQGTSELSQENLFQSQIIFFFPNKRNTKGQSIKRSNKSKGDSMPRICPPQIDPVSPSPSPRVGGHPCLRNGSGALGKLAGSRYEPTTPGVGQGTRNQKYWPWAPGNSSSSDDRQ